MYMDEYRTKLYDDNINIMGLSEPTEINYVNYSGKYVAFQVNSEDTASLNIFFQLSQQVRMQKRVVYDVFMMFGDVGGLNDFLALVLASFFGLASERFLLASLV